MDDLTRRIEHAYSVLAERTQAAAKAAELNEQARECLAWARAKAVISGVPGKNAEEREANLRYMTEEETETAYQLRRVADAANVALKLAQYEIDELFLHLRYEELVARRGEHAARTYALYPVGAERVTLAGLEPVEYRAGGNGDGV